MITMLTWIDHSTGLEWQVTPAPPMTWKDAKAYAAGLELAGGGWRLPTKEELIGISGPNHPEELQGDDWFWSSSLGDYSDTLAVVVYFRSGFAYYSDVCYDEHVRCVREGN